MPPIRSARGIIKRAQQITLARGLSTVAVPAATDPDVLEAIKGGIENQFLHGILIGDTTLIQQMCDQLEIPADGYTLLPASSEDESAKIACQLAKEGRAHVIMKGNLPTGKLLKSVLAKEFDLRRGRILSHTAVLSMPQLPRLLGITDGGMVVAPDELTRPQLVENAVELFHALDIDQPKVAMLAATDDIVPGVPITRDLAAFVKACERGMIKNCIVDGPLAFDSAVWSPISAKLTFRSRVAGSADIVVVGSLEAGNIIVKSLDILADAVFAGVIMGARIPIALVSRSDTSYSKLTSLALATVVAAHNSGRAI